MSPPRLLPLADGGELLLLDPWLPPAEAAAFLAALQAELPWEQKPIQIMGKRILQPRLVAWIGDPDAVYTYSGVQNHPLPWTATLLPLRRRIEEVAGQPFNSVLCNLYRDGQDSMGFHADKEPELGRNPVIASLSLGAPRRFQLRYTGKQAGIAGVDLALGGGSLLIMRGSTQHFWRHGIPKQQSPVGPRINLTFRRILPLSRAGERERT